MKTALIALFTFSSFSFLSDTTFAAENGWIRGSCESGSGLYRWTGGDRYEGQCLNNSFHGQGVLALKNGDRYEGNFVGNYKNGLGKLFFADGSYLIGQFKNNMAEGYGDLWDDIGHYSGTFQDGLKLDYELLRMLHTIVFLQVHSTVRGLFLH